MSNRLVQLQLYPLNLPFRHSFSHAAAQRNSTQTLVVAALLADGTIGFGEGLPRSYVTGETIESVIFNIENTLADCLDKIEPKSFPQLLETAYNLPFTNSQDQIINTARCAVELALLDAYGKYFKSSLDGIAGWLGPSGIGTGDSLKIPTVTGVLDGSNPDKLKRRFRLMRLFGLRDFKLKLGCPHDQENLDMINRHWGKQIRSGKISLRVDVNGQWDVDTAVAMSPQLAQMGICSLEQPLAREDRDHWHTLANLCKVPLMADESLVSLEDAQYLTENDLVDYFNIRISKNGGLLPAIRLAQLAGRFSCGFQLGAMVGESGILAAAGRHFLQNVPETRFTEICYGTYLLDGDIVNPPIRFGYMGKMGKLTSPGLSVNVPSKCLQKKNMGKSRKIVLA